MKWFSRNINPVFVIILTILLYAVIMILSDLTAAIGFILAFPPLFFLGMLGLAMCNYLIRFIKWQYYLRTINIRIPPAISLGIFFSGFSMTVTPAKSGELIKPYLLRSYGYPLSQTIPLVLVERLGDLLGMIVLIIIGAYTLGTGMLPIFLLLAILCLFIFILQVEPLAMVFLDAIGKIPIISKYDDRIRALYSSTYLLTRPAPMAMGISLSVVSWFFECLCLFVAISGIGFHISVLNSTFIFAFSSIAGILAMLPGGLGATEGIMMLLLSAESIPLGAANAATLLARFATLWFAVSIGVIALVVTRRYLPKKKRWVLIHV